MPFKSFPGDTSVKEPACHFRRFRFDLWLGKIPLQYSCLENPMDKGVWPATVHRVSKSWTRLKQLFMHTIQIQAKLNQDSQFT